MALNVLTMDGGGSLSLYSLYALQYIDQKLRPGFLSTIDVFGGTSAGGINALLMAAAASPEVGLQRGIDLWSGNPFDTSILRRVQASMGCISVYSNQGFVDALRPLFLNMTLGDLAERKRYVIIPSFQLKGQVAEISVTDGVVTDHVTSWAPVVYHNLGGSLDLNLSLLDVALRTSAAPVFLPIYQGHVDGGMFANNPAMAALARLLAHPVSGAGRAARPGEIRLLSVGTGQTSSFLDVQNAAWGWQQWLFDPRRPLALLEAFLSAGSLEIDAQCRTILGADNFYRLNPPHKVDGKTIDLDLEDQYLADGDPKFEQVKTLLRKAVEQSPQINRNAAAQKAKLLGSQEPAAPDVLSWLDQVDWIGGEDDRDGNAPRGGGKPGAKKATAKKATPR